MKKLYDKSQIAFSLVWIGIYVVVMNIAMQLCGGFDDLASKTVGQILPPVICITVLAVAVTLWILRNGMAQHFGLCNFKGKPGKYLGFCR